MGFTTALTLGSTALGAYGAISSGKAARAQAQYNAQVARRNAEAARMKSQFDQLRQLRRGRRVMGALRARLGASGADISEGAPLQILAEQAFENALENSLIGAEGLNQAGRYESQASGFEAQGENAMTAARVNAATTLLSGLTGAEDAGMLDFFKTKSTPSSTYINTKKASTGKYYTPTVAPRYVRKVPKGKG